MSQQEPKTKTVTTQAEQLMRRHVLLESLTGAERKAHIEFQTTMLNPDKYIDHAGVTFKRLQEIMTEEHHIHTACREPYMTSVYEISRTSPFLTNHNKCSKCGRVWVTNSGVSMHA